MYAYFDELSFNTKNLYNVGNFYIRQCLSGFKKDEKSLTPNEKEAMKYINSSIPKLNKARLDYYNKRLINESLKPIIEQKEISQYREYELLNKDKYFVSYELLDGIFKSNNQPDYIKLPAHVNQQTLKTLLNDWKSFYSSQKDYKKNPHKYKGRPRPPKYAKKNGRKTVKLTNQVCVVKGNKYLKFPKTKLQLNIGKLGALGKLKEVRIVPSNNYYTIEVVLETKTNIPEEQTPSRVIGIDLGIDNFATISNNIGLQPMIIKGKTLKSINRYYNKNRAYYYSILRQGKSTKEGLFTSNRLISLDNLRNAKIKDFMHKASFQTVKYCLENDIDTIVIGKNEGWKDNINLGSQNNQKFVTIPYNKYVEMVKYKAFERGIQVIITEESYTSKASFFDYDNIPVFSKDDAEKHSFSGKRIKRAFYKTKDGKIVNADINGSLNIILKVVPNAFGKRNIGLVSSPQVLIVA